MGQRRTAERTHHRHRRHHVGWVVVVGVWRCSRTAKWTVMRQICEGSEKEGWYFSREACSLTKHCYRTHSSHLSCLSPRPASWSYLLSFHSTSYFFHRLPCLCLARLPFTLIPSLFLPFFLPASPPPLSFPLLSLTFSSP